MSRLPSYRYVVVLAVSLTAPCVFGAEPFVQIKSPADGAILKVKGPNALTYEAATGASKGNHVHIYVDGKEVASLHRLKGSYNLKKLTPGVRELCAKLANKAHVPTGVERCIQVTVE